MLKKFFLLCALSLGASVNAYMHTEPGKIGVQGEWIFLQPTLDDTYIGQVPKNLNDPSLTNQFKNGPFPAATLDYTSGYRVEGVYAFCNDQNDVRVRVTGLQSNKSRTVPVIFPQEFTLTTAPFQSAHSKLNLEFISVEALASQKIYDCRPFYFSVSGGLNYVQIKTRQNLFFITRSGNTELQKYSDKFDGVGPELVLDFEYLCFSRMVCSCPIALSFVANFRETLLIGREGPRFIDQSNVELPNNYVCEKVWRIIPVEYLRAGFNLSSQYNCMEFSLEAGYEVMHYNKVVSVLRNAVSDFTWNDYSDVGMHGPYVALSLVF